ncbi:MAG: glycosyltransferase family 39 protein [Bacteroidia bacterium]|nr:glycosyltransferase family 39 protein [Bacteroidia bacterium]MDW8301479.1 hypothetical protein [Bacteroidia bacterium]
MVLRITEYGLFFLIAVIIRLILFGLNYDVFTSPPTATDSFGYYQRAINLTLYHTYTFPEKDNEVAFWTPGYPFLMFIVFKVFGIRISVLLLVQILMGSASLTLLYLWIQKYTDTYPCFKFFLLLFPDFILYDMQILTQCLFNTMLLVTVYLIHTQKWINYPYAIVAGLSLGYTILIKSVATFILVVFAIYVIAYHRKHASKGILLIATAILSVLPWSLRNYTLLDKFVWVHTNTQWNFYLGNHQQSKGAYGGKSSYLYDHTFLEGYTELEREQVCRARAWTFIKKHPLLAFRNNLLKISRTFSPRGAWVLYQTGYSKTGRDFAPYPITPSSRFWQWYSLPFLFFVQVFGLLGVYLGIKDLKKHFWAVVIFLAFLATFFVFLTGTNYVYLALPYLVYLAAVGLSFAHQHRIKLSIISILLIINWAFQYYSQI